MNVPATLPQTMLSMTYHSTVGRYRDEMHHDLQQAYRRFGVDASLSRLAWEFQVPDSTAVRAATEAVDRAAFERRKDGPSADSALDLALSRFFELLIPALTAELRQGVDAPDQEDRTDERDHSLSLLYHLFYSRAFRAGADARALFGEKFASDPTALAWDTVRSALMGEVRDPDALAAHVRTLCLWVGQEFREQTWVDAW